MPTADLLIYLGNDVRDYPAYIDLGTGRMLTAEPGGAYRVRSVNGEPVPPTDGRWQVAQAPPPPPPPETPKGSGKTQRPAPAEGE